MMPYVPFEYLDEPADSPVWRYMNLEKLLSILLERALFFSSISTLAATDKYEGQIMASELAGLDKRLIKEADDAYNRPILDSSFFNCWHMNDSESDAMWKIYVNGIGGIAILSSISRLKECFCNSTETISLGLIRYVDNEPNNIDHPVRRCMRKRTAFKHEQEVRLAYYDRKHLGQSGLLIPVDVGVLIEKIVVSPRADSWFLLLVENLITKLGYGIEVVSSEASAPLPIDST
jgi:hypothetical protein